MDPDNLRKKLIRAARLDVPSERVPYAFEKGVMSRLENHCPSADNLGFWARSLWRAVAPCAGIALLLGAWTLFGHNQPGNSEEFAQHFESTVLAGAASETLVE